MSATIGNTRDTLSPPAPNTAQRAVIPAILVLAAVWIVWNVVPKNGLLVASAVSVLLAGLVVLHLTLRRGYKLFWGFLVFLLFGYQFFGRGFAYVGFKPVFVGELGLALGSLAVLLALLARGGKLPGHMRRPQIAILIVFILWQAFVTLPYLSRYTFDALRDAAVWGYAAYALAICLLVPRDAIERFFRLYGRVLPIYLIWVVVAFVLFKVFTFNVRFPGAPTGFLNVKAGDLGVHLAGAAAFILLRLDRSGQGWSKAKLWSLWIIWGTAWGLYLATGNRGGMLSALIGPAVVFFWNPRTRWDRPLILGLLAALLLLNTEVRVGGREIALHKFADSVQSVVGEGSPRREGTERWRLRWWNKIVDYTFGGRYFWRGKGYGISLAVSDGFATEWEKIPNRSPHNVSMTFLARSGVPGLILWLAFLLSIGWLLLRRSWVKKQYHASLDTRYAVWLLAYFLAFLLNASVDVFLEGPMGGIWFWSLVGIILAYLPPVRRLVPERSTA